MEVIAEGLPSGKVSLSGSVSSQYLTALLMAAPLATGSGAVGCVGASPALPACLPALLCCMLLRACTPARRAAGLGFEKQLSIP